VLALGGIVTVRASHFISAVDLYPAAALAVACGMVGFSVSAWVAHKVPGWLPLMFLLSMLVGVIGTVAKDASALFVLSGVMFGLAFSGLGVATWTASNP